MHYSFKASTCMGGHSSKYLHTINELNSYQQEIFLFLWIGCEWCLQRPETLRLQREILGFLLLPSRLHICLYGNIFFIDEIHLIIVKYKFGLGPTEILAFNDRIQEFRALNTELVACSVDSHFTHLAWVNQSVVFSWYYSYLYIFYYVS